MTSPIPRKRTDPETSLESITEWLQLHSRQVTLGAIGVVVIVGGAWFYTRSQNLKAERAERALFVAEESIPGNLPLAESDLRKLITRYDGTSASMQANLMLAQILYDQGRFQDGVTALKKALPKLESSKDFASAAHLNLAAGYEQLRQFVEGAKEFEAAAKAARFDPDRQRFESFAARGYQLGGKVDDAKRIWTKLAADSKGTVAGEARVRLGEMLAQPEPKS